ENYATIASKRPMFQHSLANLFGSYLMLVYSIIERACVSAFSGESFWELPLTIYKFTRSFLTCHGRYAAYNAFLRHGFWV
ncbi:MAG: hypothetical protein KC419_22290, partial [Anaerolineales bacterium]|nr:hypothetical protein [Anaerolineales bacterium]